jgi:hypothetical protein
MKKQSSRSPSSAHVAVSESNETGASCPSLPGARRSQGQPKKKLSALARLFAERARTAWPPLRTQEQDDGVDCETGPEVAARRVARGVQDLLDNAIQLGEVERVRAVARAMRKKTRIAIPEDGDLYLWLVSFLLSGRLMEVNEVSQEAADTSALTNLASPFPRAMWFFLGQRWIQGLIAYWYQQEEGRKIKRLFFGDPQRGKDGMEATRLERRNAILYREMRERIENGASERQAAAAVSELFKKGGALAAFPAIGDKEKSEGILTPYKKLHAEEQRRERAYQELLTRAEHFSLNTTSVGAETPIKKPTP